MQNHLTSRDAIIHERGEDPEVVDRQIDESERRSGFAPEDAVTAVPKAPGKPSQAAAEDSFSNLLQ